jgi:hypothetical protein
MPTARKPTPAMETAHAIIRVNNVTYLYRPLRSSVNRPRPITPRDLTPVYSHGLNARTVQALIDRGLVRLVPHSPERGRVISV